ncbi:MAG: LysR family transcriptional regulator [Candidatus Dactylopiibacterium carminicum]|uniref:LysR family transcriptional regulator n=1 Tax=Candidatus Dactylopiibacterium carminicum TaxID=857335 RepID=A0A272EYQ1_9RHOO|nr:LysR family transcriptional regulator [Candidatus Dactylopiibacterium carminicum]KAF7600233.1 LysR family transcriptional regulator [Candidatus Dactylopiibacterium carminicum]PAS94750.1 MAG: LysR family transcriptional regulator [Candidatus Dactylopiibacterium carminicum]PAS97676.1 MAG: LysR family transcriptional regulator [Candidatus Dactylopiibacterium carminicum]PAT00227.1 MAG: LysR family transcriptional regulator [Candidatus Dactylopiibacterium carminicum]
MDRILAARVFVSIAERGSLTASAEALEMSRAMVTRYLGEMEAWAGARLFHRSTRRISLTAAGEATLARCREMLSLADQVPWVGDALSEEPRGILRIACAQSLAQASLAGAVAAFLQRHPQAAVDLQIGNKAVNLVEDRIDLAIRITNQLDPGIIARRLGECPSVVCASSAYLRAHGTPTRIEALAGHNCLTYAYFGKSLWHFEQAGEAVSVPVSGNLSANESVVLLQAAVEGAGITLQPVFSAAPLIASGQLVALLPRARPQTLGIHGLYTSREHQTALLRTMLDFLVAWFAAG